MVSDQYSQKKSKIRVLFFGDCGQGALGIINRDIQNTLHKNHPEFYYELLDWGIIENYEIFFNQKYWKEFDIVIIDPALVRVTDSGWLFEQQDIPLFKSKLIPIYHTELDIPSTHFNHGWYEGWFTTPIAGINTYIVEQIKQKGSNSVLLPIGVNTDKFIPFKKIDKIKKVGFIGSNIKEEWNYVKRPELFLEICSKANIEPVIITGREHRKEMYEDIDAIICTSVVEGLPTAFAEAAACKIPFLSTKVGIVREYPNVRTFETVDQAVDILNDFNKNPKSIKEYVDKIYKDIVPDRSWENIIDKYWVPYFNSFTEHQRNRLIQTIPGNQYSTVHSKFTFNDGDIVDIGCLGWDWSDMFLGKKRVIGVDPQETFTPEGATLFRGVLSSFDGKVQLHEQGVGARISNNGQGDWYDALSWKSFCKEYQIDKIAILKINIEGGEYPLLASMDKDDFKNIEQITISFHDWLYPEQVNQKQAILKLLQDNGFNIIQTYPTWGWYLAYK